MRVSYIVALLMIVLMVGCATTQPEAPPEAPAAPEAPPAAPEVPPVPEAPAAPAVVEGDIVITSAGFDPAEKEVVVGTTLAIKSVEGKHKLTVDGKATPEIEEGTAYDVTFDTAKTIRIFDLYTKKWLIVTVTEEAAEAAE